MKISKFLPQLYLCLLLQIYLVMFFGIGAFVIVKGHLSVKVIIFLLIISMINILREIELKQLRKNYHSQKIDQFYPQIKYD